MRLFYSRFTREGKQELLASWTIPLRRETFHDGRPEVIWQLFFLLPPAVADTCRRHNSGLGPSLTRPVCIFDNFACEITPKLCWVQIVVDSSLVFCTSIRTIISLLALLQLL